MRILDSNKLGPKRMGGKLEFADTDATKIMKGAT